MVENNTFQRAVAQKVLIRNIVQGEYKQEEEGTSNFLALEDGSKVFRVNVCATIVNKEVVGSITSFLVDDGSENIIVRFFEKLDEHYNHSIGDVVLIIGKIREYNDEKYIASEIFRKVNPLWLKLRSLELQKKMLELNQVNNIKEIVIGNKVETVKNIEQIKKENTEVSEEIVTDFIKEIDNETKTIIVPAERILIMIKEMDSGNGVDIEELIEKSTIKDVEDIVEKLIENGEIFQNLPGKVKVL